MRINLKICLLTLCFSVCLLTVSLWTRCSFDNYPLPSSFYLDKNKKGLWKDLHCLINGEYTIECKKDDLDVYVPFSFLHKYFEISGKFSKTKSDEEIFELSQCTSKLFRSKRKYDPRGVFTNFDNFKVEERERVKCVSGIEGVPVSTQWDPKGYYYPTQIAQFGLSHYSKNLTEPDRRQRTLEDGDTILGTWMSDAGSYVGRQYNQQVNSYVLNFHTDETQFVKLELDHTMDFVLGVTLSILSNSSLSVIVENIESHEVWQIHYICSNELLEVRGNDIFYGIGCHATWQTITRDLLIDVQKGKLVQTKSKIKLIKSKFTVSSILLHGSGSIDNLTLSSSEHMAQFYSAAQWLVNHQDAKSGGWPNPVTRRVTTGIADLKPGWFSAMGQGHALSVLSRAYHNSGGKKIYLFAAQKALKVFKIPSQQGGVLARFMDKYPWYEEYPTTPSMFILNGFIYSLIGLYDFVTVFPKSKTKEAQLLYDQGVNSLKHMLPLYDTGGGSKYDLRHVSLGCAPKIARCDYHATHVNQLHLLSSIIKDPVINSTAFRWADYMLGKRASHN